MTLKLKTWATLGLGAMLGASTLSACGDTAADPATDGETSEVIETAQNYAGEGEGEGEGEQGAGESGERGEGEGGEGESGEGEGEGGVSISAAATDPIVYNSALAITEAHILAARDAYAEGRTKEAAEMFAHPVSEVLVDMEPVFAQQGVEIFSGLLTEASAAAFAEGKPGRD